MKTRNANTPKSATTAKKTPVAKKSAAKTPPKPTQPSPQSSKTPPKPTEKSPESSSTAKSAEVKSVSTTKAKQVNSAPASAAPESNPEPPAVKEANAAADAVQVTSETKAVPGAKKTRTVIRKVMVRRKTKASAKAVSEETPKSGEPEQIKVEESSKKEGAQDVESVNIEEQIPANTELSAKEDEPPVENVEGSTKEDQNVEDVEESMKKEETASDAQSFIENVDTSSKEEDPVVKDTVEFSENQETSVMKEAVEEEKETKIVKDKVEPNDKPINMEKDVDEVLKVEDAPAKEDVSHDDEKMEENVDREIHEEVGDEELAEDNVVEHGEKAEALEEEPAAEIMEEEPAAEGLEEERAELTALAQERKSKRELEIFVGGLDRDATEEDVKKVFVNVGEVVEVRLHKSSSTNKNKGYAFVKFATKEQASRALAEIKNPIINGKRCGTAPSEDNNTLFLGNICNSWTKEAIKQKLKDYAIEGVESITLVPNPQHEGLSRGFAFVEFSCHSDAMLAYKRLQKPDVIFGHSERTAKVAFAEPLREPDPEVMAQVKSVFVDGLPQYWDEDRVRKQFKGYGEIERITLARNMSTAKRKDFGFVDFTTHEAAIACIDDINTKELGDGNKKTKVKARLSNPQPKIQVVKGGMCGGFRIGRGGGGTFPKNGRAFGRGGHSFNQSDFQGSRGGHSFNRSDFQGSRGGHSFNQSNFQGSRGFYQRTRGQPGMGFANEHDIDTPYASFQGRQNFGRARGRWGPFRGAHHASGGSTLPARVNLDRHRHGATDRGSGRNMPLREQPFPPEEELNRPFLGRHSDDPYHYDDSPHGMKRPYFADHDPDYLEPSRVRPRLDYADPAVPLRGSYYRDNFGAGSGLYSHSRDYYGPDYGGSAHSSFYGGHRPYGGGYYY